MRSRAESVFAGEVVGVTARVSGDGKMVWTDYEIEVSETMAGRNPGTRTTLSFGGGTVPGLKRCLAARRQRQIGGQGGWRRGGFHARQRGRAAIDQCLGGWRERTAQARIRADLQPCLAPPTPTISRPSTFLAALNPLGSAVPHNGESAPMEGKT